MNNVQSHGILEISPCPIYFLDDSVPKAAGVPSHHPKSSVATQSVKPRVLIVDDEKLIANTCAQILEDAGLETRTAYDGWSALEMLADFPPDYLLTDVLMPGMNGVQLAIAVRKLFPAVNILLFSGQAGISKVLLEGQQQGYEFELLAKPLHPLKLLENFNKH